MRYFLYAKCRFDVETLKMFFKKINNVILENDIINLYLFMINKMGDDFFESCKYRFRRSKNY